MSIEWFWYLPNDVRPGHRGDTTVEGWGSLDYSTDLAQRCEAAGWAGALVGTGWGRPDTMVTAAALAARTTSFQPLIAARPGYWDPAQFAVAAATLDSLSGGRLRVNVVTGQDSPAAYGDTEVDQPTRYARTAEFMELVRRLWTEERVTFDGDYYRVANATAQPRPFVGGARRHPRLYFGGASEAAERTAASHADVQLFWGEPLDGIAERIERLRELEQQVGERPSPLEFGLRITTVVRETSDEAWRDAEKKLAQFAESGADWLSAWHTGSAVGQKRLRDLAGDEDVLDTCLWTKPAASGGGGAATTWLVGSTEEVASALVAYAELGITTFILSDTPYREEAVRVGELLLPRVRQLLDSQARSASNSRALSP